MRRTRRLCALTFATALLGASSSQPPAHRAIVTCIHARAYLWPSAGSAPYVTNETLFTQGTQLTIVGAIRQPLAHVPGLYETATPRLGANPQVRRHYYIPAKCVGIIGQATPPSRR